MQAVVRTHAHALTNDLIALKNGKCSLDFEHGASKEVIYNHISCKQVSKCLYVTRKCTQKHNNAAIIYLFTAGGKNAGVRIFMEIIISLCLFLPGVLPPSLSLTHERSHAGPHSGSG